MAADKRDQAIGKKVAFFRGKMNWPLKTLAADLGVSIQQLQRYEKGVNKISATMLYELSRIFKVSVSSFFERTIDSSDIDYDTYNILLIANNVNDEFLLRKALSSYPKKLNIYTINDGYAAINFLIDLDETPSQTLPKPDLIFLDLHLPSVHGLDVLRSIKAKERLQEIPVIVLINSIDPEDRASAYGLQAGGFISKSFAFDEFKDRLVKAIS